MKRDLLYKEIICFLWEQIISVYNENPFSEGVRFARKAIQFGTVLPNREVQLLAIVLPWVPVLVGARHKVQESRENTFAIILHFVLNIVAKIVCPYIYII